MQRNKLSLAALLAVDMAAFSAKLAAQPAAYEKREAPPTELKAAIQAIQEAFTEYKKTNDQKLKDISENKGVADALAKLERIDDALGELQEAKKEIERLQARAARPGYKEKEERATTMDIEHRDAFLAFTRTGKNDAEYGERLRNLNDVCKKYDAHVVETKGLSKNSETRATQTVGNNNAAGGFAIPKMIEAQIDRLSVDISDIRSIARVRSIGTTDYQELFDLNGATFEWLGETGTRNQTNTPDLASVKPTMGMASCKPQASEESLDDIFFDVEGWLATSISEAIAQGEGAAFIAGNGTNRPTGFLAGPTPVATADTTRAFGTLQYVASGQAAAMPTSMDTLLDMVYALRKRYRRNARWVGSKLMMAALRKYKDTTGQYLWQPAVTAGQPDVFLGYPVMEAEDMPSVVANAFPLAFGDFYEGYMIVDRVGMRITRDEITTPGFVKFYVRKRVGGILRNTQAIKLLKIATS